MASSQQTVPADDPLKQEEVELFRDRARQVKAGDDAYLASQPELKILLNDLTMAFLKEKPTALVEFARAFFETYDLKRNVAEEGAQ